jgi:hypothetical protein
MQCLNTEYDHDESSVTQDKRLISITDMPLSKSSLHHMSHKMRVLLPRTQLHKHMTTTMTTEQTVSKVTKFACFLQQKMISSWEFTFTERVLCLLDICKWQYFEMFSSYRGGDNKIICVFLTNCQTWECCTKFTQEIFKKT